LETVLQRSDAELVQHAARGDRGAFHLLVDRHANHLLKLAFSLSSNRDDADDIVQETFTAAFVGLKKFAGRSSVKTWLSSILMRRAAKIWHRSKRLRMAVPLDAANASSESDRPTNLNPGSLAVASTVTSVDQRIDLQAVLETLSEPHREVIVLREMQGLSYEEIAEVLGVPRGTVESRLHRARQELQAKLTSYVP
jgi:RNA polymerase sigma-70 factor (ECF subfamily)